MPTNITINILATLVTKVTDFHWVLLTRMYQQCYALSTAPALLLLIPSSLQLSRMLLLQNEAERAAFGEIK